MGDAYRYFAAAEEKLARALERLNAEARAAAEEAAEAAEAGGAEAHAENVPGWRHAQARLRVEAEAARDDAAAAIAAAVGEHGFKDHVKKKTPTKTLLGRPVTSVVKHLGRQYGTVAESMGKSAPSELLLSDFSPASPGLTRMIAFGLRPGDKAELLARALDASCAASFEAVAPLPVHLLPKLTVCTWNIRASMPMHIGANSLADKAAALASVVREHGAALAVLQECPGARLAAAQRTSVPVSRGPWQPASASLGAAAAGNGNAAGADGDAEGDREELFDLADAAEALANKMGQLEVAADAPDADAAAAAAGVLADAAIPPEPADAAPLAAAGPFAQAGAAARPQRVQQMGEAVSAALDGWIYREAQTGAEAAGFAFDPRVLRLVSEPAAFREDGPLRAGEERFQRPPVLAVFAAADTHFAAGAVPLGLIAVCSVHLKAVENGRPADRTQPELRRLAGDVTGWIETTLDTLKESGMAPAAAPTTTLILGDFNLAFQQPGGALAGGNPATDPGTAWTGLVKPRPSGCGFRPLLPVGTRTNISELAALGACYDNALLRCSDGVPICASTTGAAVAEVLRSDLADMDRVVAAAEALGPLAPLAAEFVGRLRHLFAEKLVYRRWSDHKPVVVTLQCERGAPPPPPGNVVDVVVAGNQQQDKHHGGSVGGEKMQELPDGGARVKQADGSPLSPQLLATREL